MATDVWVFFSESNGDATLRPRREIRTLSGQHDWGFQERLVRTFKTNVSGRSKPIIPGNVATNLYQRMHRAQLAVLAADDLWVATHPDLKEACRRDLLVRLSVFCRYKSFYLKFPPEGNAAWTDLFSAWCSATRCEGERDPRCLPLHIFKAQDSNLDIPLQRAAFDSIHGSGAERSDADGRRWRLAPHDFHGQERLCVAGWELRQGFHWDVEPGRNTTTIVTTKEVWRVERYVNIYPDGHVRGRAPFAKKINAP